MIKYSIFVDYLQYLTDQYWYKVFEDCSKGKFPKKSGYDEGNNSIWFKNGNIVIWYRLSNNPENDLNAIKKHFKEYLKMYSENDRKENKHLFDVLKKELDKNYIGDWKNIKKKNIKDSLIRHYILSLKDKHNLTIEETITIFKDIRQAIIFGWITSDDVVYSDKNREIENITSVVINPDKTVTIKYTPTKITEKEYCSDNLTMLVNLWRKKLLNL